MYSKVSNVSEIRQDKRNYQMTEEQFWDKFNKKHNPRYYHATKNQKKIKLESKRQRRYPLFKGQS
jgi:hypothetical protein